MITSLFAHLPYPLQYGLVASLGLLGLVQHVPVSLRIPAYPRIHFLDLFHCTSFVSACSAQL